MYRLGWQDQWRHACNKQAPRGSSSNASLQKQTRSHPRGPRLGLGNHGLTASAKRGWTLGQGRVSVKSSYLKPGYSAIDVVHLGRELMHRAQKGLGGGQQGWHPSHLGDHGNRHPNTLPLGSLQEKQRPHIQHLSHAFSLPS